MSAKKLSHSMNTNIMKIIYLQYFFFPVLFSSIFKNILLFELSTITLLMRAISELGPFKAVLTGLDSILHITSESFFSFW